MKLKTSAIALLLICQLAIAGEGKPASKLLEAGDVVAICGDSITSNGHYPYFMEAYALMCAPNPKVTFINFGRWGWRAKKFAPTIEKAVLPSKPTVVTFCYGMNSCRSSRVMSAGGAAGWGGVVKGIVKQFRKAGVREFILGSPGCVDSTFFTLAQSRPPVPGPIKSTNKNLSLLGDAARKVATDEKIRFVDVHTPMIQVMAKAKAKYGKNFAFAGGGGDGVHPRQAGHLVMAWVFLKGLGYDGDLGTVTLDMKKSSAAATDGHKVLASSAGEISLESTRYPFCFYKNKGKLNWCSTQSVAEMFPFNPDLNRLMLVVKGAGQGKNKFTVTWGKASKTFEAARLEKGINLAAEFMNANPFKTPFKKIMTAMHERNRMRSLLRRAQHKNNASFKKRLARAIENMKVKPLKHTLKLTPPK
jgi:GDSL-like Lipase/Acylhydrolase family